MSRRSLVGGKKKGFNADGYRQLAGSTKPLASAPSPCFGQRCATLVKPFTRKQRFINLFKKKIKSVDCDQLTGQFQLSGAVSSGPGESVGGVCTCDAFEGLQSGENLAAGPLKTTG